MASKCEVLPLHLLCHVQSGLRAVYIDVLTQMELGHSLDVCAHTTGHSCTHANPSCVKSHVANSSVKKNISW